MWFRLPWFLLRRSYSNGAGLIIGLRPGLGRTQQVELEPSRSKSMAPFCSTTNLFEPLTLALKVSHPSTRIAHVARRSPFTAT